MQIKKSFYTKYIIFLLTVVFATSLFAADKDGEQNRSTFKTRQVNDGPIVEDDWKFHKIGTLWSRVTNFGKTGDDAYQGRTPSGDWPGGSGNSYLYRGSPWISAFVDGEVHSTQPEDSEYAPLDSVHFYTDDPRAPSATYTRYYDVNAPLAGSGHFPLGVEVTERTYAWPESFRDDFIIYEMTIKNVGIDTDNDGLPELENGYNLEEFYFTYRLDGDVSKLPDWDAEYQFSNQDDHAGVNASWDMLTLFPEWEQTIQDLGSTVEEALGVPDSTLMFMWDGDNPQVRAWDNDENAPDDDTFNPGINGKYQTPGFLGFRILKTEPASFRPSSFHTNHIYNDPASDQESYDRMMAPKEFQSDGPSGVLVNPSTGLPFPNDYRAVMSLGPLDVLAPGDSVIITFALGVGADPDSAGIYSLMELVNIMDVAKLIVDKDYVLTTNTAPNPEVELKAYVENGITKGTRILWSKEPSTHESFKGYRVYRSQGRDANNNFIWDTLAVFNIDHPNWPPQEAEDDPSKFELIDTDVTRGLVYYYSVTSYSEDPFFGPNDPNPGTNVETVIPSAVPQTDLSRVKVVPNPFVASARWDNPVPGDADPWKHRLRFINIPADATIKIYTLDFDFVDEVRAGDVALVSSDFVPATNEGVAEWDLITRNDQEAAPGIYIYVVDSPSAGQKIGKFVVVR